MVSPGKNLYFTVHSLSKSAFPPILWPSENLNHHDWSSVHINDFMNHIKLFKFKLTCLNVSDQKGMFMWYMNLYHAAKQQNSQCLVYCLSQMWVFLLDSQAWFPDGEIFYNAFTVSYMSDHLKLDKITSDVTHPKYNIDLRHHNDSADPCWLKGKCVIIFVKDLSVTARWSII